MPQPHILLVEMQDGNTVGVQFATLELARKFEDELGLSVVGCVPLLTQTHCILERPKR